MSKYNRNNFIKIEKNKYGSERDLVSNSFDRKRFIYPTSKYQITADDVARPDLLSYRIYKKFEWWWLLLKFNGIDDVWNELYPGMFISVPDPRDFSSYVTEYSRG
jgi:hypothetical protein